MQINDISKFLIRNTIVVYAMTTLAIVSSIMTYIAFQKSLEESRKYIYVYQAGTTGEIVPMHVTARRDNLEIECKGHLVNFATLYYGASHDNYDISKEKAVWLGDFLELYKASRRVKLKESIITYGIKNVAYILPENFVITKVSDDLFKFNIMINLDTKIGNSIKRSVIVASGDIEVVERNFPHNPHGLFIKNYNEERTIELTENE